MVQINSRLLSMFQVWNKILILLTRLKQLHQSCSWSSLFKGLSNQAKRSLSILNWLTWTQQRRQRPWKTGSWYKPPQPYFNSLKPSNYKSSGRRKEINLKSIKLSCRSKSKMEPEIELKLWSHNSRHHRKLSLIMKEALKSQGVIPCWLPKRHHKLLWRSHLKLRNHSSPIHQS